MNRKITCLLLICLLVFFIGNNTITYASNDKVVFYTEGSETRNISEDYLLDNAQELLIEIGYTYEIDPIDLRIGRLLSIVDIPDCFIAPVFDDNDKCICLISVYWHDGLLQNITYSNINSEIFDNLDSGRYYLSKNGSGIFLIAEYGNYLVDKDYNFLGAEKRISFSNDTINNFEIVNFYDDFIFNSINFDKSSDFGNRGYYSGALSVPYVANGGVYGYCWCSSSAAICQFYGYSTTPTDVHIIGHGTSHTLNYCPGGSPSEAYSAIHAITSKTGNVDMQGIRNNAPNVKSSIDSGIPVYSSWGYYSGGNRIGHAMVICGYTYHDSTGVFTYKIMDPNNTSYRYVYSTYNASSITCLVGTNTYTWEYSIYDFQ